MSKRWNNFYDWENEIKKYCEDNELNFEKARKLSRCQNAEMLALQYFDEKAESNGLGLLDETPMPVVLIITKIGDELIFEQTENTKKYIGN